MYKLIVKPFFDVTLSFAFLLVMSPIFIVITIFLFISNSGKPFFTQKRPGKCGRIFKIIKFKTMTDAKDSSGKLLSDEKRLTKVGMLARKTSLDELPQLLNVIKGDMSIIGPRPLLPSYLDLYTKEQARRHDVKPGITGWAQVNGRNNLTWKRKFELDIFYVNNLSLILDIQILYKTFFKVLLREDINKDGSITTVRFNGKN